MAHNPEGNRKQVHYVGDSRVRADRPKLYPPDYSEFPGKTEAFIPDFLLKEWMVAAVFLVGFMTLVMSELPPLGEKADPTNTSFLPVPDWYFLFLYQLLKYKWASGPYVVIGTVILPGIAGAALLLAPWLDRSKERRPHKRPVATGLMIVTIIAICALTWAAEAEHEKQLESAPGRKPKEAKVIAADERGYQLYKQSACIKCHGDQLQGVNGPHLIGVGNKPGMSAEKIIEIMNNGRGMMPAGMFQGSKEDQKVLAEWLMKQKQK
ncbi:menaquinol-cytochrome c reductase cytochrome b/c subunit [Thermoflavimicrobium dichotomicum]|uniref:Menaquinol-cytochrome c reductase cytochrome b/c subunit n=1 Tax=Thermoflavimicrobium dichotomicum TaxID=46223 RepID=A0A1I3SKH6_9BACL|nr:menaquinol-cytochrome c reductase cytochrome b/c subunit [Thermoflavimicrobium dichotomicum]SFJ58900.1 menaquinol-cytochrome c reductase cytochrome b/c subunit [Thermoflavimicrobium dichotomicum]